MALASFAVAPRSAEQFAVWSFSHAAHHRDIIRRIRETRSIQLVEYVLDPFDPLNPGIWADQHQEMHDKMNETLYGLAGQELTEIDWSDQDNLSVWLARNYAEHARAGATLGV